MIIVGAETTTESSTPVWVTAAPRLNIGVFMTGVDGSLWDMHDGPVCFTDGVRLGVAEPEHWSSSAPAVPGSSWLGRHVPDADPMWPVHVRPTDDSLVWRDIDAAFKKAVGHGDAEVLHTVVTPDGLSRSRAARYVSGFNVDRDMDPLMKRSSIYPIDWKCAQPFWQGPTQTTTFSVADPPDFIDSPFDGYYLAPSHTAASAVVNNPGDVETFAKWTVTGSMTGFTVGIGASLVSIDYTQSAGESVVIDMDPRSLTVTDGNGVDLRSFLTDRKFTAVPPGDAQLTIDVSGSDDTTVVVLELVPLFWEPW